jgi:uncharacterized protein
MLRLEIGAVPEGVSSAELESNPSEWGEPVEVGRLEAPVRLKLDVTRKGQDLYLKGKASVRAVLQCGRCLEEYTCDLAAPIGVWVVVGGSAGGSDTEKRENVIEVKNGARYADLTEHVRSELLVQLPLKQVCRDDCKGLCPECGTNMNLDTCGCKKEAHDSRWEALKEFKRNP